MDRTELEKSRGLVKERQVEHLRAALVLYLQSADPLGSITDSQNRPCVTPISLTQLGVPLESAVSLTPSFFNPLLAKGRHETSPDYSVYHHYIPPPPKTTITLIKKYRPSPTSALSSSPIIY